MITNVVKMTSRRPVRLENRISRRENDLFLVWYSLNDDSYSMRDLCRAKQKLRFVVRS